MESRPLPRPPRRRSAQSVRVSIGIVCTVLLVIAGLAFLGAMVLFAVGLSHYGSNK